MRQAIALLAARNGYEHTTKTAIDTLAQLAEATMSDVALRCVVYYMGVLYNRRRTHDMVAHSHRTQPIHYDVLTAIGMRRGVGRASKLKSFAEYAMNAVRNGRRCEIFEILRFYKTRRSDHTNPAATRRLERPAAIPSRGAVVDKDDEHAGRSTMVALSTRCAHLQIDVYQYCLFGFH